jgi:hypothetical protein
LTRALTPNPCAAQAEEAEAPAGEGDDEAQYEITQKGEASDAQVLADALLTLTPNPDPNADP